MATIEQVDRTNNLLGQIYKATLSSSGGTDPILQDIETNTATTAANTTQMASDITAIALNVDSMKTTLEALNDRDILDNWTLIAGNFKEFEYYPSGPSTGNPSGNPNNIRFVRFRAGGSTVLTQTFTYDDNDNVLSETAS